MKRRGAIALLTAAALLLVALLALRLALRPEFLGPHILALAGEALDLRIEAESFDYRLRGTPQLVARDVVARSRDGTDTLLTADRVLVSLPWSTLRSRGAELVIERIELDAPVADLAALQRWWAARPPGDGRLPTLSNGLSVAGGRLLGDGWLVRDLALELPSFAPGRRVRAHLRGRYVAGTLQAPFDLHAAMTRPAEDAGVGLAGAISPAAEGWRLPSALVLSTRLAPAHAAGGMRLQRLRLSMRSRYLSGAVVEPFVLGLAAEGAVAEGALSLRPAALVLRGGGLVPRLRARGAIGLGTALALQLEGELARWPEAWPALPPPVGGSASPLPFTLAYRGGMSLEDPLALRLERDDTRFDARLRVSEIASWADSLETGSPLPPLSGRLTAPRLEISGAVLHGVEVEFEDDTIPVPDEVP
ncbi:hypothetical protein QFW77_15150 [Luteimonas sp. RD2P54]|uniref:AsmA family protein n=1 Tax=Luteimonas endophytica TaxID=3042023 RepID=A0ABT6JBW2_9GAMM|nr:hypothetical protein [Luteimonas endophytica]MDH5824313.1 hypothetical protein [Luteimonas endophytica]